MIGGVRMKKGLYRVVLLCVLTCLILPGGVGRAEDNFVYGMINGSTVSCDDWGNEGVMLRVYKNDGTIAVYVCSENMTVNGAAYEDIYDMQEAIPDNVFAAFTMKDGVIAALNFGAEAKEYNNITYDIDKKCFNGIEKDVSALPIYYDYCGEFIRPYLDENHVYNVKVYDYAVCITSFKAINKPLTVSCIDMSDTFNARFKRVLCVESYFDNEEAKLKAQLFDSADKLLDSAETLCSGFGSISFDNLPNEDAAYTVKIHLENDEGEILSHTYTKEYTVKSSPVLCGKVGGSIVFADEWGNEGVMLRVYKNDEITGDYICSKNSPINGVVYKDVNDMQEAIKIGADIKYALKDGEIAALTIGREIIDSVTCERSGNKISVKVKFISLSSEGRLYLAVFGENGALEKIDYVSAVQGQDEYVIDSEAGENCRVKVFLFDEALIKPLVEAMAADIQ